MSMQSEAGGIRAAGVRIECGGEVVYATETTWQAVADDLFAKHGTVPKVTGNRASVLEPVPEPAATTDVTGLLADDADTIRPDASSDDVHALAAVLGAGQLGDSFGGRVAAAASGLTGRSGLTLVVPQAERGVTVSEAGRARSQADFDAATRAGFSSAQTLYERGTMVIEVGVNNARKKRAEFLAMPTTREGCEGVIATVTAEERRDIDTEVQSMRMNQDGQLAFLDAGQELVRPLTVNAFGGLCSRLGFGGAAYLGEKCWPSLRAHNVNQQLERSNQAEECVREAIAADGKPVPALRSLRLRERTNVDSKAREVFAAVTESYTAWDVDQIAHALREAAPADARGRVTYDGQRARFEVLFHSTVKPEDYVAGEFFRAGVVIKTDDTGGGSIGGSAVVWQNLCLNLIIIDQARNGVFSIRHIGSLERLVATFREGFTNALGSIEHFRKAWGYAVHEDAVKRAANAAEEPIIPVSQALPGLFRGIIERELVPVFARTEVAIPKLMTMWERDTSSARTVHEASRASVVNAFTRYAHEAVQLDAWQEDQVQKAAGSLLYRAQPLPYMPEPSKR